MAMYKCLTEDNKSWYDGTTEWTPGKWMAHIANSNDTAECGAGYHLGLSINDAMSYGRMPCRIWTAEGKKRYGAGQDKKRYGKARIIEDVTPDYILAANEFIKSIKNVRRFSQCKRPLKSWQLYDTRAAAWDAARDACWAAPWAATWAAARAAAWDAARDAVRAAAWDAARDAAGAAVRDAARDAAGAATWAAARDAAWDATWDAARAAAWDAARDALLQVMIIICDGLPLDKKHINHAKKRWDVWVRGYGLTCDVNGVLYVYNKP